jgi:hypothetical protein
MLQETAERNAARDHTAACVRRGGCVSDAAARSGSQRDGELGHVCIRVLLAVWLSDRSNRLQNLSGDASDLHVDKFPVAIVDSRPEATSAT